MLIVTTALEKRIIRYNQIPHIKTVAATTTIMKENNRKSY